VNLEIILAMLGEKLDKEALARYKCDEPSAIKSAIEDSKAIIAEKPHKRKETLLPSAMPSQLQLPASSPLTPDGHRSISRTSPKLLARSNRLSAFTLI
jgi:hypothetical protein